MSNGFFQFERFTIRRHVWIKIFLRRESEKHFRYSAVQANRAVRFTICAETVDKIIYVGRCRSGDKVRREEFYQAAQCVFVSPLRICRAVLTAYELLNYIIAEIFDVDYCCVICFR